MITCCYKNYSSSASPRFRHSARWSRGCQSFVYIHAKIDSNNTIKNLKPFFIIIFLIETFFFHILSCRKVHQPKIIKKQRKASTIGS